MLLLLGHPTYLLSKEGSAFATGAQRRGYCALLLLLLQLRCTACAPLCVEDVGMLVRTGSRGSHLSIGRNIVADACVCACACLHSGYISFFRTMVAATAIIIARLTSC